MLLCNLHRNAFSALLPELAARLQLRPSQLGELQAAMLGAYLLGQVPAGALADRHGGARVLLWGLLGWSAATALTALAAAPQAGADEAFVAAVEAVGGGALGALLLSRVLLGLASACAMPCVSAAAVAWVPARSRAGAVALVYGLFNIGGVCGLILAPALAQWLGLGAAFVAAGALGAAWAAAGGAYLVATLAAPAQTGGGGGGKAAAVAGPSGRDVPVAGAAPSLASGPAEPEQQPPQRQRQQQQQQQQEHNQLHNSPTQQQPLLQQQPLQQQQPPQEGQAGGQLTVLGMRLSPEGARQVLVLCAAHACIGYGFFLMQNWIPLYLSSLGGGGGAGPGGIGGASSLPWLAAALVGVSSGGVADRLIRAGARPLAVRRAFQCASFLGCAASALPLAAAGAPPVGLAVACLTLNLAFYSLSFGGFHAYLQDVAGPSAGVLQGLTNSCSILTGMAGSLATGWLVEAAGSYSSVFWFLAALYVAAAAMWATCTSGEPLAGTAAPAPGAAAGLALAPAPAPAAGAAAAQAGGVLAAPAAAAALAAAPAAGTAAGAAAGQAAGASAACGGGSGGAY